MSSERLANHVDKDYATFSMPNETLEIPGATPGVPPGSTADGSQANGNGRIATFNQGSDEEMRLGSRVTFAGDDQKVSIEEEGRMVQFHIGDEEQLHREQWDNKTQFYMGVISYAVGLGNVWRFPYLCQKNGGGAFLIPYCIMMVLGGLPLFLIELGIGQRLRTGPVGVWNAIHPYLGGVGVAEAVVSYLVALYYNVIVTWCLYYFYRSWTFNLPWEHCPVDTNGTKLPECAASSSVTMYFWNREALDTSSSIGDIQGFNWHILVSLVVAWILIYLCVMKGIKSSGKVMYATATFPYVVTTIFLFRSITLEGAAEGLGYMISPDLSKLYSPGVWLDAATQIFYSMGLGFGGLIAFGSYNPLKNNCKRDAIILAGVNVVTSLYTAVVIFGVLGYMAHKNMGDCITKDMTQMASFYPETFKSYNAVREAFTDSQWKHQMEIKFEKYPAMTNASLYCDYGKIISEAAEGTGLAFVVFTEAILQFPFPPFWSILFFLMLISLGLGSMFGTLEGVITSLNDSHLVTVKKPVLTAVLCGSACFIGLIFSTKAGQYWVSLFDAFAGSYALMCVAFMEIISVIYVYGFDRFARDIEFMTGEYPSEYWLIMWRFVCPIILGVLFITSVGQIFSNPPYYFSYDYVTATLERTSYPMWALWIAIFMVVSAIFAVPMVAFIRHFKIMKGEPDIQAASKRLNTTQSTTYMLKSEQSFNRMTESSVSVDAEPRIMNHTPKSTRSA